MRAGKLRHQITIQRLTGVRDSSGAETDTWETFKTVWASIEPSTGGAEMFLMGQQFQGVTTARICLRYTAGITPKYRVSFCGRLFDILAVHNKEERSREIELVVKEHQ